MSPTMFEQAAAFGDQLREAAAIRPAGPPLDASDPPTSVLICGLGGSAAGGRLASALLASRLRAPVLSQDQPGLPGFVGAGTLVVVCSYSGETREAIDWWHEAAARGARRLVVTSGGTLGREAAESGATLVSVPGGFAPRGALGWLLGSVLVGLEAVGASEPLGGLIEELAAAADAAALAHGPNSDGKSPRRAAEALAGLPTVFYGSGMRAAAAVRIKNQVNENAKAAAFAGAVPEIAHNEVLGWLGSTRHGLPFAAVVLRDHAEPPAVAGLLDAIVEMLRPDARSLQEWRGDGPTEAARLISLLAYGDYVSCHLGLIEHQDLDDITRLGALKKALARSAGAS
jgi:glucose/mannose-6-phosphate isomerase